MKRIGLDTYAEARTALTSFLRRVLKDVGVITEGARRMTVTVPDVLLALKHNGRCGSHSCQQCQHVLAAAAHCVFYVLCLLPSINCRTLYGFGEINSLEQYTTRIKKPVKQEALQVST